jgi:hypothetical protein
LLFNFIGVEEKDEAICLEAFKGKRLRDFDGVEEIRRIVAVPVAAFRVEENQSGNQAFDLVGLPFLKLRA